MPTPKHDIVISCLSLSEYGTIVSRAEFPLGTARNGASFWRSRHDTKPTRGFRKQDTTRRTLQILRHDTTSCRGGRPRLSCRSRRRNIHLAIISCKIAHLYATRRESPIKPANSCLVPIYFLSTPHQISTNAGTGFVPIRAHAKLHRHGVEITLNTTRRGSCPTASQCGTAADTKHEARVLCLRLSQHDTVRAREFSARYTKHGTITTLAQNLQMTQIPPAFILPLLSPLSTTLRYPFSTAPVPKFQPASGKPRPRAGVVKCIRRTKFLWMTFRV